MRRSNRHHRGPRADWVYRGFKWQLDDPTIQESFLSGTYYNPISLAASSEGATAQVLYDSNNYIGSRFGGEETLGGNERRLAVGSPARPDGKGGGALIHGVDVFVNVHKADTTWTTTARIYLALRVIVAEQDMLTGQALLYPGYSMWNNQLGSQVGSIDVFANSRQNCWEGRYYKARRTDETGLDMVIAKRVRFKRRLQAEEGLFLYCELHSNSTPITGSGDFINFFCRSLVSDSSAV